jgi:putative hydrolase of the HAD superfamily
MKRDQAFTTLFLDIGGVLLTNGWDHQARKRASKKFNLDQAEMSRRHRMIFDAFEKGEVTLEEYLRRVVFYRKRPFTRDRFRKFIFAQSAPHPRMIGLVRALKAKYGLKIAVVSNEGRELNAYRIRTFELDRFVDFFISSCFVHLRKPDMDIFRMALDISQTPAAKIVFIDNTPSFARRAARLGMRGIVHTTYESTRAKLAALGLKS